MANHELEKVEHGEVIDHSHHDNAESPLHEASEIELAPIAKFTFVIFVVMFGSMVIILVLYNFWFTQFATRTTGASPLVNLKQPITDPMLQVDEAYQLRQIRDEKAAAAEAGTEHIEIDEAMKRVAEAGRLPGGPDWSLRGDEQMVGGVILNAEQVKYANTPPSEAPAGSPPPTFAEVPKATPAPGTAPAAGAAPAAGPAPVAAPGAAPKPAPPAAPKPKAVGNAAGN